MKTLGQVVSNFGGVSECVESAVRQMWGGVLCELVRGSSSELGAGQIPVYAL